MIMQFLKISWQQLEKLCKLLAKKIQNNNYSPDILVGVARGGLVPVRLLSDYLGLFNVAIIKVEFYKAIGKTNHAPQITQALNVDVKGKRVLIVDDVSDSGKSLVAAREHVLGKGAKEVRIATLHYKLHSILKPDYFIGKTSAWIIYPWEKEETKRELKK